jgi:hypothetical protein
VRDRDLGESQFRERLWLEWRVEIGELGDLPRISPPFQFLGKLPAQLPAMPTFRKATAEPVPLGELRSRGLRQL